MHGVLVIKKPKNLHLPSVTSIEEARRIVVQNRKDAGCICPVCDQIVAVYRRSITSTMLVALSIFYRHARQHGDAWLHFPRHTRTNDVVAGQGGDWAKLAFWDLIERKEEVRTDGSSRNGWARITPYGRDFVEQKSRLPRYIYLYNNQLVGIDTTDLVDVVTLAGQPFRYDELFGTVDKADPILTVGS